MHPFVEKFKEIPMKKIILWLIVVVAMLFVLLFGWNQLINKKLVTLTPSPNTTITIGKQTGDDLIIKKQIASTNSQKKLRLSPGTYIVKYSGSSDYQETTTVVQIDKPKELKTPLMQYTTAKLDQILKTEQPAIKKAMLAVQPSSGYAVDTEKLFFTGEWYGARLVPNDWYAAGDQTASGKKTPNPNSTQDVMRVILKKEGGTWIVAAGPSIIFNLQEQKNIPEDVVRATNKLGFN